MLPVTGPISVTKSEPYSTLTRKIYRQAMPIDRPLPYEMNYVFGRDFGTDYSGYSYSVKNVSFDAYNSYGLTNLRTAARNRAYERLRGLVSDSAGWAENLAQYDKTRKGFVDRAVQLSHFASALRQRRFGDAARILRTPLPSAVSHRKAISQNFLEFEYGVKPLISDLQSSWKIICGDPGSRRINASAREHFAQTTFNRSGNAVSGSQFLERVSSVMTCKMGATVRVDNPNLFLANQLGLLDLALPWKLIPFSFVVDWFVNVEQAISSLTDFLGLSLEDQYTSEFAKATLSKSTYTYWNSGVGWTRDQREQTNVQLKRTDSISYPVLQIKPFRAFSCERGAQAISLVLSVFGK